MIIVDITINEAGSDINAIEELLAEAYERVEKQHITVVERRKGAVICNRHAAVRFRVVPHGVNDMEFWLGELPRIRNRTNGNVHVDRNGIRNTYGPGPA
tara:strand:+ start:340 stop:636 length:297 start_codon:yes stop_codon:yes gene_type:complete